MRPVSERGWLLYHLAMLRRHADPRRVNCVSGGGEATGARGERPGASLPMPYSGAACSIAMPGRSRRASRRLRRVSPCWRPCRQQRETNRRDWQRSAFRRTSTTIAAPTPSGWVSSGRFAEAGALAARVLAAPPPASVPHGLFGAAYGEAIGALRETAITLGRPDAARQASIQFGEMVHDLGHDYIAYLNWVLDGSQCDPALFH